MVRENRRSGNPHTYLRFAVAGQTQQIRFVLRHVQFSPLRVNITSPDDHVALRRYGGTVTLAKAHLRHAQTFQKFYFGEQALERHFFELQR